MKEMSSHSLGTSKRRWYIASVLAIPTTREDWGTSKNRIVLSSEQSLPSNQRWYLFHTHYDALGLLLLDDIKFITSTSS